MRRREFLAVVGTSLVVPRVLFAQDHAAHDMGTASGQQAGCPTYASVKEAMTSPRETLAYVPAIYVGTGRDRPDYLATVDVDPASKTFSKVVDRLAMPNVGDELHHFGWNICSSCHGHPGKVRSHLVVPGLTSGNVHFIDVRDPSRPKLHKVIAGEEIARKTDLSGPHTVHCAPDGTIIISMLGDAQGRAPGGFLAIDQDFNVTGPWARQTEGMNFNYDFWYQPRLNVMVSTEWAAPQTVRQGFKLEDVQAGKYGRHIHFWDWKDRRIVQSLDLGENGLVPLEVRFHHNPDSAHGFVGAALSSAIWHFHRKGDAWTAEKIIQADPVEVAGWPFAVPGLTTDLVLSLDDRWLYLSNWLHGDIRQYDVSDPSRPKLVGQVWLGGVLGKAVRINGEQLPGGPQMLQLSLDGKRLYVTNSLYSVWDNQFYPDIAKRGSYMLQFDCDTTRGGMTRNKDFYVDFGAEPGGPARAHEIRFPGGDCTSDIWV